MADVEQAWLAWARRLFRNDAHRAPCVAAQDKLRVTNKPMWNGIVAPGLRWPGYLGPDYRRGGILSVGIVHTSFATGGMATGTEVPAALAAHVAWTAGTLPDADWLTAMRAMYRKGLSWQRAAGIGWDVATYHHQYWKGLGETVDSVAYVNAMRCQYPGDQPTENVRKECLAALPLTDLISVLQPRLVLSNSKLAQEQLQQVVPTLYINQRGGANLRTVDIDIPSGHATIAIGTLPDTVAALVRAGLGPGRARPTQ